MARLNKEQWRLLRIDYEVKAMTLAQLSDKYGADRGNISKRAKKEAWEREEVQQIIAEKVNAAKDLAESQKKITTLSTTGVVDIDKEVTHRLELEGMFADSIKFNQSLANQQLKIMGNGAELQHINLHSQITNRNKDGALGKMPTTQVNIQNNNDVGMTAPIIAIPAQETEETWRK
ncbi:MAG: hypothetical protein R8M45_05755 [Ghiorsea sp.]